LRVYIPRGFPLRFKDAYKPPLAELIECPDSREICPGVWTTGTFGDLRLTEQGLCVNTSKGWVVITGCAHPGADEMAEAASRITKAPPYLVVGGYHLPPETRDDAQNRSARKRIAGVLTRLEKTGVKRVAPCHCSGDLARKMCKERFGERCELVGVGHVFQFAAETRETGAAADPK
jgi:7,8-dihydropterin-6-yl-methyl-4-(beta-D-ribofuranosyl)aminobenzene 5'-phosphate synthase